MNIENASIFVKRAKLIRIKKHEEVDWRGLMLSNKKFRPIITLEPALGIEYHGPILNIKRFLKVMRKVHVGVSCYKRTCFAETDMSNCISGSHLSQNIHRLLLNIKANDRCMGADPGIW